MLNRAILLLSLLGLIVTLHLWVQKERNFDHGCWGLGTAAAPATAGCQDPALQQAGRLFGVSTAAWGYALYVLIAGLALGRAALPERAARRCVDLSEIAIVCAVPYTLYLLFIQAAVAHAYCPLCLVSTGLVLALFGLHVVQWRRGGFVAAGSDGERTQEMGYAALLTFGGGAGLLAVLLFVDQVATRGLDPAATTRAPARVETAVRRPPTLNLGEWARPDTPVLGNSRRVVVTAFFDPNCPHCGGVYSTIINLADRYKDSATFYVFPRILWDYSTLQVQALEVAKQHGKYFDMWRLQFAHQRHGGLTETDLAGLFKDLGIDTPDLPTQLAAVRTRVLELRDQARATGINSTPTIFVNDMLVEGASRSWDGLAALIEQAARPPAAANKPQEPEGKTE